MENIRLQAIVAGIILVCGFSVQTSAQAQTTKRTSIKANGTTRWSINAGVETCDEPQTDYVNEKSGFRLGWKPFTGVQYNPLFLELAWRDVGKMDHVAYRAASLSLGCRF